MNWIDKIEKNKSLKELTTWKIGGLADYFALIESVEELEQAAAWAKSKELPIFILGGGSNLLISDEGFRGLVLKIANRDLSMAGNKLTVGAGVNLQVAVQAAIEAGLGGLEWAQGIPGLIGGAVRGNASAYGGETKDCLERVCFFDLSSGEWQELSAIECQLTYRSSLFKQNNNLVIWQAVFALTPAKTVELRAKALAIALKRLARVPSEPSAGSVFQNLLIAELPPSASELIGRYSEQIKGGKLACGLVIEELGFKGRGVGGALVSQRHANIIVNVGQATAAEVLVLLAQIKTAAFDRYGLELIEEVEKVGF
ncbi:MAG: UDP-N-acetylmuramate dehydrogenase [Candidatus Falkowbacteria bacterium]